MRKTIILLLVTAFSLAGLAQDTKAPDAKPNQTEDAKPQAATAPATNKKIAANSKVFQTGAELMDVLVHLKR